MNSLCTMKPLGQQQIQNRNSASFSDVKLVKCEFLNQQFIGKNGFVDPRMRTTGVLEPVLHFVHFVSIALQRTDDSVSTRVLAPSYEAKLDCLFLGVGPKTDALNQPEYFEIQRHETSSHAHEVGGQSDYDANPKKSEIMRAKL